MRFMLLLKASENQGLGDPPPELFAEIMKLGAEAEQAGVMIENGGFAPTMMSARVKLSDGEISVVNGPFDGAELQVSAYSIYQLNSIDEAVTWATRFLQIHKDNWKGFEGEAELRQIFGPDDFSPPQ